MTKHDVAALQRSLRYFSQHFGLHFCDDLADDGELGPHTRQAIVEAKFYLGYGKRQRHDGKVKGLFVRRLRHPHSPHWFTPKMYTTSFARRVKRRKQIAEGGGAAERLFRECKRISDAGGPYVWGGGHSRPLRDTSSVGLDCSGSVSLALWRAGLYADDWARVSGAFETWGAAGPGRTHTIHCNGEHVWIQFHGPLLKHGFWRFDTSPHNCQSFGPRVRTCVRDTSGFVSRHVPGL